MNLYALLLATFGVHLLRPSPHVASRGVALTTLGIFALGLGAVLYPVATYLSLSDYLIHFALFHLVGGAVLVSAARERRFAPLFTAPFEVLRSHMASIAAGAVLVLGVTVVSYAGLGALEPLIFDMWVLPRGVQNYYTPIRMPTTSLAVAGLGLVLCLAGTIRGIHGWTGEDSRRRSAIALCFAGIAMMVVARFAIAGPGPDLYREGFLRRIPFAFDGWVAPITSLALIILIAVRSESPLMPRNRGAAERIREAATQNEEAPSLDASGLLPLLFFQFMLAYQAFPRADQNLWLLQPALAPGMAIAVYLWASPWRFARRERGRRFLSGALAAAIPIWLIGPLVLQVVTDDASARRALNLPHTSGIALLPKQIQQGEWADVERLVARLADEAPASAPIFLLSNYDGIRFFSGRRALYPDKVFHLFLAGWGMLPKGMQRELDTPEMLTRLGAERDVILIAHPDITSRNLKRALPRLSRFIETHFESREQFGRFRILRRNAM